MVEARLAKTDAVLAACSVAAMGALARAYLVPRRGRLPRSTVLIFWLAVAAGVLVKGPLVPMFAALAVLALFCPRALGALASGAASRSRRAHRAGAGAALVRRHRGEERRRVLHRVGRARHARQGRHGAEQHWRPPGFYLVAFFAHLLARRRRSPPSRSPFAWRTGARTHRLRARLDRAVLARLRGRADEAAALRACRSIRPSPS